MDREDRSHGPLVHFDCGAALLSLAPAILPRVPLLLCNRKPFSGSTVVIIPIREVTPATLSPCWKVTNASAILVWKTQMKTPDCADSKTQFYFFRNLRVAPPQTNHRTEECGNRNEVSRCVEAEVIFRARQIGSRAE